MFSFAVPIAAWILLAVAVLAALIALTYGLNPICRASEFENPEAPAEGERTPKASVVVYSHDDDDVLMDCLDRVAAQDYPDFEVIVVCDASSEYSEMLYERISAVHPGIYVTFIPPGSHNLSRRKLATTIGVKAAKGEVVVTTMSNVVIPSEHWLSELMAPFCGESGRSMDVSLGVTMMDFRELTGAARWYHQFVSVLENALWVGYAAHGDAYRGDGFNLAFRRQTFIAHKGYAKTVNIHNGDDDLFISEISTGANTAVTLGPDNMLTTEWGEGANRIWAQRKEAYDFTAKWLPQAPFRRAWTLGLCQWIVPLCWAAASLVALPSLVPLIVGALVTLAFWGMEIKAYREVAARFGAVRLWWAVVPFWFWLPLGNLLFNFNHRHSRIKNFTWQRARR